MGTAVAAGDLTGDNRAEVIAGSPGEFIKTSKAGAISMLYGASPELAINDNLFLNQNGFGVQSSAEPGDLFGAPIAATSGSS
jgi:hypothetical protein